MHERNREKFLSDFVKQHQNKGCPLGAKTPREALDHVAGELGTRPKASFVAYGVQDASGQVVQVIENVATSEIVQMPPGQWEVHLAQDPQFTIVTDGNSSFYAASLFETQPPPAASAGGMLPMGSVGWAQPQPAASVGGAVLLSSSSGSVGACGGPCVTYGMACMGTSQAAVSQLGGQSGALPCMQCKR